MLRVSKAAISFALSLADKYPKTAVGIVAALGVGVMTSCEVLMGSGGAASVLAPKADAALQNGQITSEEHMAFFKVIGAILGGMPPEQVLGLTGVLLDKLLPGLAGIVTTLLMARFLPNRALLGKDQADTLIRMTNRAGE
jgi:hypothetical protein